MTCNPLPIVPISTWFPRMPVREVKGEFCMTWHQWFWFHYFISKCSTKKKTKLFPSPFLAPLFFLMISIAGPVVLCLSVHMCLLDPSSMCCGPGQELSSSSVLLLPLEQKYPSPCLDLTSTYVRAILLVQYCIWRVWISRHIFLFIFSFSSRLKGGIFTQDLHRLRLFSILLEVAFLSVFQVLT